MNPLHDLDAQGGLISTSLKNKQIRALVLSRLSESDIDGVDRELFRVVASGSKMLPGMLTKEADARLCHLEASLLSMPDLAEIKKWITSVEDKTALRKQRALLLDQLTAIDKGATADTVSSATVSGMAGLMSRINMQTSYTMADAVSLGRSTVDRWLGGDPFAGLVPTYIKELDDVLGGLVPGQVTTIGGRPSTAKTTLALQITRNNVLKILADKRDAVCVFVSLEMTPATITFRLASSISGVNWKDLRKKMTTKVETEAWLRAHDSIRGWPMVIKKMAAPTPAQVMTAIELEAAAHKDGVALIVVDFIELMSGEGSNETAQVSFIMKGLKTIAERFSCPLLNLSQLSRDVEKRADRMPETQDLRQSGMIEAVSEQIMLLCYPGAYQTTIQASQGKWPNSKLQEQAEELGRKGANYLIMIKKNRDDDPGRGVPLLFEKIYTRFSPPDPARFNSLDAARKRLEAREAKDEKDDDDLLDGKVA